MSILEACNRIRHDSAHSDPALSMAAGFPTFSPTNCNRTCAFEQNDHKMLGRAAAPTQSLDMLRDCDSAESSNRLASDLAASGERPSRRARRQFFLRPSRRLPSERTLLHPWLVAHVHFWMRFCLRYWTRVKAYGRLQLLSPASRAVGKEKDVEMKSLSKVLSLAKSPEVKFV